MDLRFTPEELAFREEVRAFIRENLPADTRDRMKLGHPPRKEDTVRWQRILNAKGWAALSWPKEWGGPGWTAIQKMIFLEENLMAPAPELLSFNITMLGPVLLQFGTDEQKKSFQPRAATIDDRWCQAFSEPGAGSDQASPEDRGEAGRRPLCGERPEDLDLDRPSRRLVFPAGPHRSQRAQAAGGDFVPAGGHEDAWRHGAPDHFDRRQPPP